MRHVATITVTAATKRELALALLEAIEGVAKALPDAVAEDEAPLPIDRYVAEGDVAIHVRHERR
jgi:hypothetical protein